MSTNIYILKLEHGKWYVGKSDDPVTRYRHHINGTGSSWTKKYIPVSLEKVINDVSHFEEDKVTKEYMSKYGIENVRGGSYCNIELDEFQVEALHREIWGAQNKCARCGRSGHFQKDCYAKSDINGNNIIECMVYACEKCEEEFEDETDCIRHEKYCGKANTCYRCGRTGHYSPDCYAKTHIKGFYIR